MCIDMYEYAKGPSRSVAQKGVVAVDSAALLTRFDQGLNLKMDSMFSNMSLNVDLG
jgi:hypothetical protein